MAYTERNRSPSPPVPPVSKGDRRRRQLQDRLTDMVSNFSKDRDQHYRAQMHALQIDMNLIARADVYVDSPLDDDPDTIYDLVKEIIGGSLPQNQGAQQDFFAMAGRGYEKFVQEVNKAQEERDAGLTMLYNRRQSIEDEVHYSSHWRRHLAKEELQQLKNTLRERLISVLSSRRAKMLRDKEQLDIADSNAAFLHPNQFSITNPSSPGGPQNPRKTRHTRHQRGDPDETVDIGSKRKRRPYHDDYETGSPAPAARNIDYGAGSPFRNAKSQLLQTQYEAPLYSIERLFSEKELAMAHNAATVATAHHFAQLKIQDPSSAAQQPPTTSPSHPNNNHHDIDDVASASAAPTDGPPRSGDLATTHDGAADDDNNTPPNPILAAAAPDMDRSASTQTQTHYHATRHATRNLSALGDLAAVAASASASINDRTLIPFPSIRPVVLPVSKTNALAPPLSVLSGSEVDQDLALMGLSGNGSSGSGGGGANVGDNRDGNHHNSSTTMSSLGLSPSAEKELTDRLLERACAPSMSQFVGLRVPGLAVQGGNGNHIGAESAIRGLAGGAGAGAGVGSGSMMMGGVPMSAQSSMAGASDAPGGMGGVPMNRMEGSSRGGLGMKRTASGAGAATSDFVKRMKGRVQ